MKSMKQWLFLAWVFVPGISSLAWGQLTATPNALDAFNQSSGTSTTQTPGTNTSPPGTPLQQPGVGTSSSIMPPQTGLPPPNSANTNFYSQLTPLQNTPNITFSQNTSPPTAGVNSGTASVATLPPPQIGSFTDPSQTTGVIGNTGQAAGTAAPPGSTANSGSSTSSSGLEPTTP